MNLGSRGPDSLRHLTEVERARLKRTAYELHERGLGYQAISVVFDLYEGAPAPPRAIRHWLALPPNPNYARVMRERRSKGGRAA